MVNGKEDPKVDNHRTQRLSTTDVSSRLSAGSMRRAWRFGASVALFSIMAVYLTGCFTADATLNADGSGTVEVSYPVAPGANPDSEKARWSSPYVTLKSFTPKANNSAVASVTFSDATKLSTAEGFKQVQVTRTRQDGGEHIRIVISNPRPNPNAKDEGRPGIRLSATLPGNVKEANRGAEVQGNRVTWRVPLAEFLRTSSTELLVDYVPGNPPGASGDGKDKPAPAAEPSGKKPEG